LRRLYGAGVEGEDVSDKKESQSEPLLIPQRLYDQLFDTTGIEWDDVVAREQGLDDLEKRLHAEYVECVEGGKYLALVFELRWVLMSAGRALNYLRTKLDSYAGRIADLEAELERRTCP
jgi:hypothetical protein